MSDDWRLQIDFRRGGETEALQERLDARDLEHDLSDAFHDRVVVSRDGATLFLYAGDREQAEKAQELIERLVREAGEKVDVDLRHWHPAAEEWEAPDVPVDPTTEHEALMDRERKEAAVGHPEFEVRVDLASRHEALELARRLQSEGLPTVHRWRFVLVGASDEDTARALAERIRAEAPTDSEVAVEGTWSAAYAERPPSPFAFLGGLAG